MALYSWFLTQYKDFAKFCQEAQSDMLIPAPAPDSSVPHTVVLFKGHTDEFMVYGLAIPQLSQRFRLLSLLKTKVVCNCIEHCIQSQSDCALKRKRENNRGK
jgi:hypothetical protein